MRYLLITLPGLERLSGAEACEMWPGAQVLAEDPPLVGGVRLDVDAAFPWERLRTVLHVVRLHQETRVRTLDELRAALDEADIPELAGAASFRASAHLVGNQPFARDQAAGAAGARLKDRYRLPVDLEGYAVNVRLDVHGDRLLVGTQLTADRFAKRLHRSRSLRASLKPTLAAAMLRLAGAASGPGRLLDPLCGAGTIAIEAKTMNPALEVSASDWDRATVGVAEGTVANHGVNVRIRQVDARALARGWNERFDYIVTNPPFGQRLGRGVSLSDFYRQLLASFLEVLGEGARIVILTPRLKALDRASVGLPLELVERIAVTTGGIVPRLSLLARA